MNSFELVGDPSRVSLTFITIPDVFTGARLFSAKYIMEFFGNVGLNQAQHFLLFSEIKPLSRIQGLHYQTAVFCKCDTVNRFYWLASWESAFFSIRESNRHSKPVCCGVLEVVDAFARKPLHTKTLE